MSFWNPGPMLARRRPGSHELAGLSQPPMYSGAQVGGQLPPNLMPMQTGGVDPAMPGMQTGGPMPPMQAPGMQTGGYDPAHMQPGMPMGGQLPPQAQGYGYGLARMGTSRPDNGSFAQMNNRLAGRMLVR